MKKAALTMTAFTIIASGLAGCGTAEDNEMGASPTRYSGYDNNMDGRDAGGNYRSDNYRGEGPVTDMMTVDDRQHGRNDRGTADNRGQIGDRNGMVGERGNLNTRNVNDGNQMNDRTGNQGNNQQEAEEIANKVENIDGVDDSRVIVRDNDILIGVDTYEDGEKADRMADKIKRQVEKNAGDGKNVYVTTDEEQYGNIQEIDNNLQNGMGLNEAGDTINAMIEDLSNAAQRPFENS
ncbi:sporulation lipoprotein, YhcN/YlaJ family [Alteribacillus persepolensis]|uniref:Sporulation lipoprotein, YhcN/YlaJ family n=1 Tax=Alteribacillus persepolensis TaxID=568899 RepID=A0A1G8DGR0_9BACI|nr:YhcN/YlaJ family sporulation lipoprotein [Alteribacillus persepolensis]SDH56813.1 sporulation lipoprotein, YhcN/YlaJ family [Alteribacillus persepolensis]